MPLSAKAKQEYIKKLDALMRASHHLDEQTVKSLQDLAKTMRQSIHAALLALAEVRKDKLTTIDTQQFYTAMRQQVAKFEVEATAALQGAVGKIQDMGIEAVQLLVKEAHLISPVLSITTDMVAIAQGYSATLITGLVEETVKKIEGELSRAMLGEVSPYDAMKLVDQAMGVGLDTGVTAKAERIVRTELTRAYNGAQQFGYEKLAELLPGDQPNLLKKMWVSAKQPGRTRPAHWEADGQIVGWDEPFIVGGEELRYPGDPQGSAGNTINCLCRVEQAPGVLEELITYQEAENV